MSTAFNSFEEIKKNNDVLIQQRLWMKEYEGFTYSIAEHGIHKIKWATENRQYHDDIFKPEINCIKEKMDRVRIEFDDKDEEGLKDKLKIKKNLDEVKKIIETNNWGYIESSHNGASNYLWVEFTRDLTDQEKQLFLMWICPEGAEIDLNFSSSKKVFPILFAPHWKYPFREMPVHYHVGNKIDFDSLNISQTERKKIKRLKTVTNDFPYITGIKEAASIFSIKKQAEYLQKEIPYFYDRSRVFWLWDDLNKYYKVVDEVDLLNMITDATGKDIISQKTRAEIINSLKQEGRRRIPLPIKPTWIQFKGIIVDIMTGERFEVTPDYFVTNPIPWELHLDNFENTPTLDKLFEEWVGEDHVRTLYEILSYCLLPDYPIHRLFCFIGSGNNGKSCFLNLLRKFIGDSNCCATELDTLLISRFEVTRLHKKLVCQMGETNFSEMSKTSILKKLTGGDLIGMEYKRGNHFDDKNYAKIIISTNNLPVTTDKTIGFYRRWMIIDFPNRFNEKEDILSKIPEEEYKSLALKCINILRDILVNREFTNEGDIEERMKRYEEKSDPLQKFISEFTTDEDVNAFIPKWEFKKRLDEWLHEHRFRSISERTLIKYMNDKGIEDGKSYVDWFENDQISKKQVRTWVGLQWKKA